MEWCQHISPERAKELAEQFPYFSTHNHTEISNFRLRDSIIRIPDLINYAIDLNYAGICCTDHEALSAHVRLIKHYKDLKENNKLPENFKIGLGNEIYLVEDLDNIKRYWHFILIAKDKKGYEQLKRISSESAWTHWSKGFMERVPTLMSDMEEIIGEEKGHLIFQSACLGSYLDNLILELHKSGYVDKTIKKKIDKFIKWCINLAGKDNFYLEIQPSKLHLDENGNKLVTDQMIVNQFMFKLSKGYGLKVVVSTDSHYPRPEDARIHESYLKADDKDKSKEREVASFYETAYMFDKAELIETLSDYLTEEQIIEAFNGTMDVHNKIEFYDLYHPVIVPTDKNLPEFKIRHIFKDYYNDYEYIKKYAESDNVQDQYLLYLVENGFEKRDKWEDTIYHFVTYDYDGKVTEEYDKVITLEDKIKRINEEFSSFWQISEKIDQKLSAYYTLVRGLVQNVMWKRSYVGGGRGSAAGSYLCYLIEITQINPLKFDLPFWRHSSPLRPELPDIDVDTEAGQRQQIFADMRDYYGEPNVLNTLTLRTEGSKATVLALARGFKIPNEDGQFMADLIPFERGANWPFKDCFEGNEEKGRLPQTEFINEVAKYPGFKEALLKIEGLICGRSIHASAAYVFDNGYLVQNSKMRAPNGTWITAFNMEDSDYMGGLKVDCLTIENLDKLHQAIDLLIQDGVIEDKGDIKANYDAYLHPDVLDYNNYEMWNLIDSNKITDAFQFDTPMGKQVIMKTQPRSMIELATANSLMRLMAQEDAIEAPMDTYKRYKNDISLWYDEMKEHHLNDDEIKVLEKHLKSLFGVADTQESIMELSMDPKISGFDVVLANKLRKSVA